MEHNVHYHVRKRPPIAHILRQTDPLYNFTHYDTSVSGSFEWIRLCPNSVLTFVTRRYIRVEKLLNTGPHRKSGGPLFLLSATAYSKHFQLCLCLEKGSCINNVRTSLGVLTGTHLTCQMCFSFTTDGMHKSN